MTQPVEAFERCGLISLDDFEDPGWRRIFAHLEAVQADFLSHEHEFRSPDYFWERDVLHGWSRCWEYPYAFYHVRRWLAAQTFSSPPTVVDLGSGVTYFPFAIACEGCSVVCLDIDPIAERDINLARDVVDARPGSVAFAMTDGLHVPLDDGAADALYCVSVLEHIADPVPVIAEAARVLKPGGLFVVTLDIDLRGNVDIGPEKLRPVMRAIDDRFERIVPERFVHPRRMLDTVSGPYPRKKERQQPGLMWRTAENKMLPVLGGPTLTEPTHLACYAAAMTRRR